MPILEIHCSDKPQENRTAYAMKNDQIEKYWTFSSPVKFTSKEKYPNTGCVIDSSDFEVKILFCEILTLEFGRY